MTMTRKDIEREIVRICGCEEGSSFYEAKAKTESAVAWMLGESPEQMAVYAKKQKRSYSPQPFPSISYNDSCLLYAVYTETDDEELRDLIANIVAASLAETIICNSKKRLRDNPWRLGNTQEVLNAYITGCYMKVRKYIDWYDAKQNAAIDTWLICCVDHWIQSIEWDCFRDQNSFRTDKKTWIKVKSAMEQCKEMLINPTAETVLEIVTKNDRQKTGSTHTYRIKTIETAMGEIKHFNRRPISLDSYRSRNDENQTSLHEKIADMNLRNPGKYDSAVEEITLELDDLDDPYTDSDALPKAEDPCNTLYGETAEGQKLRMALEHSSALYASVKWFSDYLYNTVLPGNVPFKTSSDLIRIAASEYAKQTGCTPTQRRKFEAEIRTTLDSLAANEENVFSNYDQSPSNPFDDEPGAKDSLEAYWDGLIGGGNG